MGEFTTMVGMCEENGSKCSKKTKDSFRRKGRRKKYLEKDGRTNCVGTWRQDDTGKDRWRKINKK